MPAMHENFPRNEAIMATLREYLVESPIRHHNLVYLDEDLNYPSRDRYGKEDSDFEAYYVEVLHTAWGDYDGSSVVERSNFLHFEELWDGHVANADDDAEAFTDLVRIDHSYSLSGGRVLMVLDAELTEELQDVLEGLADYPVIDEQLMSQVEEELFAEDWESWLEHDLRSEVEKALTPKDSYEGDADVEEMIGDADRLLSLFHEAENEFGDNPAWAAETSTSGYIQGTYRDGKWVNGLTTLAGDIVTLILREYVNRGVDIDGQDVLDLESPCCDWMAS